jgi:hypothetical protein
MALGWAGLAYYMHVKNRDWDGGWEKKEHLMTSKIYVLGIWLTTSSLRASAQTYKIMYRLSCVTGLLVPVVGCGCPMNLLGERL